MTLPLSVMSLSEGKDGDRWLFSQGFGEWSLFVARCVYVCSCFHLQGDDELYYFTSVLGNK